MKTILAVVCCLVGCGTVFAERFGAVSKGSALPKPKGGHYRIVTREIAGDDDHLEYGFPLNTGFVTHVHEWTVNDTNETRACGCRGIAVRCREHGFRRGCAVREAGDLVRGRAGDDHRESGAGTGRWRMGDVQARGASEVARAGRLPLLALGAEPLLGGREEKGRRPNPVRGNRLGSVSAVK